MRRPDHRRPPRITRRLLEIVLPAGLRDEVLGDLDKEYADRLATGRAADRWLRSQVLRSLPHALACRMREIREAGLGSLVVRAEGLLRGVAADTRQVVRSLRRRPSFAVLTTLLLAGGIGASSAAFSVIHAVVLRPLPYPEADRIVYLYGSGVDSENYQALMGEFASLSDVAVHGVAVATIAGGSELRRATVMPVSEAFFTVIGIEPSVGRSFGPSDHTGASERAAIVSARLAIRHFGSTSNALGRLVTVAGQDFTVVGVMATDFEFHRFAETEVWIPLVWWPEPGRRVLGRLRPSASVEDARLDAERIAERIAQPGEDRGEVTAVPLAEAVVGFYKDGLWLLAFVVALALAIAVANASGLILLQSERRSTELALRNALGASRVRLALLAFIEAATLASIAGLIALFAARWLIEALLSLQPDSLPRATEIGTDPTVVGFTFLLALGSSLVSGMAPALTVPATLGARSPVGKSTPGAVRARSVLVIGQVGLATVLLIGTAALARTYAVLYPSDPGFSWRDKVAFRLELPERDYADVFERGALIGSLREELAALPGVGDVSVATDLPLTRTNLAFRVATEASTDLHTVQFRAISENHLEVMGIPILRGRGIEAADVAGTKPVAIVNERMADEFWPGINPVGRTIRLPTITRGEVEWEVVGVARDAWTSPGRARADAEIFVPLAQDGAGSVAFVLEARHSAPLTTAITEIVRRHAPRVPIVGPNGRRRAPGPYSDVVSDGLAPWRYQLTLVGVFAGLAILLAAAGLYGVLSSAVARERHSMAVRIALGGTPGSIGARVIRGSLTLVAIGAAGGAVAAHVGARFLEAFVLGVGPADPLNHIIAIGVVCAVGLVACVTPVARAARTEPVAVLRGE